MNNLIGRIGGPIQLLRIPKISYNLWYSCSNLYHPNRCGILMEPFVHIFSFCLLVYNIHYHAVFIEKLPIYLLHKHPELLLYRHCILLVQIGEVQGLLWNQAGLIGFELPVSSQPPIASLGASATGFVCCICCFVNITVCKIYSYPCTG